MWSARGLGGFVCHQIRGVAPLLSLPTDLEGVFWLCLCTLLLFRRRWWQWSSMNFIEQRLSRVILQQPLQMYSCMLSVFRPSIHIQMCCVRKFVAILRPNCQFCQILQQGFCANNNSLQPWQACWQFVIKTCPLSASQISKQHRPTQTYKQSD